MDLQNIRDIIKLMETLGFSPSMDKKIAYYLSFRLKEFNIKEQKAFGDDITGYQIFFRQSEADKKIVCTHYDAALLKNREIKPDVINAIDAQKLDQKMKTIDWVEVSQFNTLPPLNLNDKENWKEQTTIEKIIYELEELSAVEEGKYLAHYLQYKYWMGLPLESMIPNLFLVKSKLEYTQRFYIIGNEGIRADEAYRFLNNRWIQCQVQENRKSAKPPDTSRAPSFNAKKKKSNAKTK